MAAKGTAAEHRDAAFGYDEAALNGWRARKPWQSDPLYFKHVRIAGGAAMKMLMHAHSGVEKGMKKGGKPIEIMGMMVGRIDTDNENTVLVTDAFALPIEGTETAVLAGTTEVDNFMIQAVDALDLTRHEGLVGWYHSHPFDVDVHDHCFLSSIDVQSQNLWQFQEDRHHNPFVAIVIDPLRSMAKGRPIFGAFRSYPQEGYTPEPNTCPDGRVVADSNARQERWGHASASYYKLSVDFYQSRMAATSLGILSKKFLWTRMLSTTPMLDKESRDSLGQRVAGVANKLDGLSLKRDTFGAGADEKKFDAVTAASSSLAAELCQAQIAQVVKGALFNKSDEAGSTAPASGVGAGAGAGAGAAASGAAAAGGACDDDDVAMSPA